MIAIPNPWLTIVPAVRGKISSVGNLSSGIFRLPSDPLYYTTLTLDNIVVGSRYRISRHSDNLELATGVAASTTEILTGIPVYSSNMLIDITVRLASTSPFYKIFDTAVTASPFGVSSYILQQLDE